jgi:hypothetical protein
MWDSRLIQHRVSTACTVEAAMSSWPAIWTGPSRFRHLSFTMHRTVLGVVLVGLRCGRELRSSMPQAPWARYRPAHFLAVRAATMNILAAAA